MGQCALAVVLTGWIGVYVTRYWQPILYLVAAVVFGGSVVVVTYLFAKAETYS